MLAKFLCRNVNAADKEVIYGRNGHCIVQKGLQNPFGFQSKTEFKNL